MKKHPSKKKLQISKKAIAQLTNDDKANIVGGQQNGFPTTIISQAICSILNSCISAKGTECIA